MEGVWGTSELNPRPEGQVDPPCLALFDPASRSPQEEEAHLVKLEAFIRRVEHATTLPPAWAGAMRAWNGTGAGDWPALLATLPAITTGMRDWCAQLTAEEDLARGLMRFYADRVESPPVKSHPGINTR